MQFRTVLSLTAFVCSLGFSGELPKCFDFTKKLTAPLRPPIELGSKESDSMQNGKGEDGLEWGAVRGIVKLPILNALKKFEDPFLTKNRNNTTITPKITRTPNYVWIRNMHLDVKPVFFISVEWDEEWAVSIIEGTEAAPQSFIVYYQKVAGTSHIDRLCGSILVTAKDAEHSDVFLFEEVKSSHWSGEDAVKNFQIVLKIFRGQHKG